MIVCIQCAMKALVEGKDPPSFPDETAEQHLRKYHPDPVKTRQERNELEQKLMESMNAKIQD